MAEALTKNDFDEVTKTGVTLVDFWAEWCGPCKMIAPMLEELATEFDGKADVRKVNVDDEPDLAARFNVSSIPTLLIMSNGEEAKRFIGVTSKAELSAALTEAAQA